MAHFPVRTCPRCGFTTKRTTTLEKHLIDVHGLNPCIVYVGAFHDGIHPRCACGCGTSIPWKGWRVGLATYILGHNAQLSSLPPDEAETIKRKRMETLQAHLADGTVVGWNKGLTKETDERLAETAKKQSATVQAQFDSGRTAWSKGLTQKTDARVAATSQRAKDDYAAGRRVPAMKGKTKKTDEKVMAMSLRVQKALGNPELQERLSRLKLLSREEVVRRVGAVMTGFRFIDIIDGYQGVTVKNICLSCLTCGSQTMLSLYGLHDRCHVCHPSGSAQEIELVSLIGSLGFTPQFRTRSIITPLELDIYIPERSFAIEHNGLYWHSEDDGPECDIERMKHRHSRKTELCAQQGIRLLHVFSDEWRDKRAIVASMVASRLGVSSRRVSARDCSVVQLDDASQREFFQRTHIDGDVRSMHAWGLSHEGTVVAALSLRRPMHTSLQGFDEVARFSCELGHNVIGGLGKLVTQATRYRPNVPLLSYVDTRYGDGHGYERVGFKLIRTTQNRYWYTDNVDRFDRFRFRADPTQDLSEAEVAHRAGVHRVWGCPNRVYVLDPRASQPITPGT